LAEGLACPDCSQVFSLLMPVIPDEPVPSASARPANPDQVWIAQTVAGPIGPLSGREVVAAAREGRIDPATMLTCVCSGREIRAGEVPGLLSPGGAVHNAAKPAPVSAVVPQKGNGKRRPPAEWFVLTDSGEMGPVKWSELTALARKGVVSPNTLLRPANSSTRLAARQVPSLVRLFA
jgi:hypothetical protein